RRIFSNSSALQSPLSLCPEQTSVILCIRVPHHSLGTILCHPMALWLLLEISPPNVHNEGRAACGPSLSIVWLGVTRHMARTCSPRVRYEDNRAARNTGNSLGSTTLKPAPP